MTYTHTDSFRFKAKDALLLEQKGHCSKNKLGLLKNDLDNDAVVFWERNLGPNLSLFYSLDKNGLIEEHIKGSGFGKGQLTRQMFLDEKPVVLSRHGEHKVGENITAKHKKLGVSTGDVLYIEYNRTFNPVWKKQKLVDNRYVPRSYKVVVK